MADGRICDHPDDDQLGAFGPQLGAESFQGVLVVNFLRKGSIDQDDVVVFQRFHADVHDGFVFKITDIFFKKTGAAVDFFSGGYEYPVGQGNQSVFVKINDVFQVFGKLF